MKRRLEQIASQSVKQIQRLILSPQMQQALHLLQLPVLELSTVIQEELTQNPLLELDNDNGEDHFDVLSRLDQEMRSCGFNERREEDDLKAFIENTVTIEMSLFDSLMQQANEAFSEKKHLDIAEIIIGNLDCGGILTSTIFELCSLSGIEEEDFRAVLEKIQTFEPLGVGAENFQEALLIQLRNHGKEKTLAFRILKDHYEEVLQNRIPQIAKALKKTTQEIYEAISEEISHLDLHPGLNEPEGHYRAITQHLIPDVTIDYCEEKFTIHINDERIPHLRLNKEYLKLAHCESVSEELKTYIQEKIASSRWLLRNLHERSNTLYRICNELTKMQSVFFSHPSGKLNPSTMKAVAEKLDLHESTIARAVANKYVSCPRGILPLRSFFTHSYTTDEGEQISSETVKDLLRDIISKEDKKHPFSDETISCLIKEKGIFCARRTVAKYRQELGMGNTLQRKIH